MSKLAFDAVGKYIHPTSYRQIVEIESLNQLTSEEQGFCRKTKYRVQLLPKFTIKSDDRAKFLWRLTKLQESKGLEVDKLNTIHWNFGKGKPVFLPKGCYSHWERANPEETHSAHEILGRRGRLFQEKN